MLRHLVARGRGRCKAPYSAQSSPHSRIIQPQLSVEPTWRNPGRTTQQSWIILGFHLLRVILGKSLTSLRFSVSICKRSLPPTKGWMGS